MKIITFNMSSQFEWDKGIYNRNKHVLEELSKREDVEEILSVDFLPFNLKSFLRLYLKSKIYKKIGKNVIAMGHHYVARRLNDKVVSLSAANCRKVHKAAVRLGFENAIIINFNPLNVDYIKIFKNNKKYFDAVDNWINNSIFEKYKNILENNYKEIVKKSNYVFTVSEKMKEYLENITYCKQITKTAKACIDVDNKIEFISNGVDLDHYKNPKISEHIENIIKDIRKKYSKIVGYLGVIKNDRVDIDLLEYIIKDNSDIFFLIAGPIHGVFDVSRFEKYENVYFMGEVKYKDMPFLYEQLDVCIIPHLVNDFIRSMDPKKLYEYLASGKPVVSTSVSGVGKFDNIVKIAQSNEGFSRDIKEIFKDQANFSKESVIARQKSIEAFDWKDIVGRMISKMK